MVLFINFGEDWKQNIPPPLCSAVFPQMMLFVTVGEEPALGWPWLSLHEIPPPKSAVLWEIVLFAMVGEDAYVQRIPLPSFPVMILLMIVGQA